jgi:hypothetical protein
MSNNDTQSASGEAIRVVVRCRPFNKREKEGKFPKCCAINPDKGTLAIRNLAANEQDEKLFTFDSVFDDDSIQVYFVLCAAETVA